jgi:2-amino-4-hydroxy-6-hydroxymethyldihydropteridine diphosphokinase
MLRAATELFSYAFDGHICTSNAVITAPVGPAQPDFLNAAIAVRTQAPAEALLALALKMEQRLGRERTVRWGPRTMDVDVLWAQDLVCESDELTIPHARLRERTFALRPLLELEPNAQDPRDFARYSEVYRALIAAESATASPASSRSIASVGYGLQNRFETIVLTHHTADEGFRVFALDRADVLAAAAEAVGNTMIDAQSVRATKVIAVEASSPDPQGFTDDSERLWSWLSEVLFTLESQRIALKRVCILADEPTVVRGMILGEPLDFSRHAMGTAIKAITYHDLTIAPISAEQHAAHPLDQWSAEVIVDV